MLLVDAVRALAFVGFEGLDRVSGLLHRAGHEPADRVLLPVHLFHNLGQRGSVLALEHCDHLSRLAAFARCRGLLRGLFSLGPQTLTAAEKRAIKREAERAEAGQMSFFDGWEPEEDPGDLLTRDFRRALKARAMQHKMPIQIGRDNVFVDGEGNQDPATRAWNMSVALYYKAGGIPWRLKLDGPQTCFVGVSFHHMKTTRRHFVHSSIAQAFSSDGDGFALRGELVPWNPEQGRRLHLSEAQACKLGERILNEYAELNGTEPRRIVLHKTSKFDDAEIDGFKEAFARVPIVELINLMPTMFRLLQYGAYPPARGTLCTLNGAGFLFTTGFVLEWGTYPGPHIPAPIRIMSPDEIDLQRAASEILGLTRINWNTAQNTSGQPVTLRFARRVGGIMAEVGK